jgi:hypothetical protein
LRAVVLVSTYSHGPMNGIAAVTISRTGISA